MAGGAPGAIPFRVGTTVAGRFVLFLAETPGVPVGIFVVSTGILDPFVGETLPPAGYACVANGLPEVPTCPAVSAANARRRSATFLWPGVSLSSPRPMAANGVANDDAVVDTVDSPAPLPTPVVGVAGATPLPDAWPVARAAACWRV